MIKYLFIFGNHPVLSLIELESVAAMVDKKITVKMLLANIAEVISEAELDVAWWQARLGGTVKIAKIRNQVNETKLETTIKQIFQPQPNKKFVFGISSYSIIKTDTNKLGMSLKRYLTDQGIKTRFVIGREKILSSVIVDKNKLITDGGEFILIKIKDDVIIATTESVQDFAAFSERDYGRPAADAKNGMLPPKLAKIMINLAKVKLDKILLDPFCGSGTVLQEALFMGYAKISGNDISEKAVNDTKRNLTWLASKHAEIKLDKVETAVADATKLSDYYKKSSLDAIITEPYLGPVDKSNIAGKSEQLFKELENTYNKFVTQAALVLKKDGTLVMVVPIIMGKTMNYKQALTKNGLNELFPAEYSVEQAKYSRMNQRVERLIVVAQKQ